MSQLPAASFCRFAGEAYELNTYDKCPDEVLAADVAEAKLAPELRRRLLAAYEVRRDVLAGKPVSGSSSAAMCVA